MHRAIMLLLGMLALTSRSASAAQTVSSFELGLTAFEGDVRLAQLGARVASAKPNALGGEFAVATTPQGLAEGIVVVGLDFSLSYTRAIQRDLLLVGRGGASALAAFGVGGAAGVPGYHFGFGVVVREQRSTGVRVDYTLRKIPGDYGAWSLSSLTLGIGWYH